MTAHTPDQMAMARRIAGKTLPEDARGYSDFAWLTARDAALAAILETSELAARPDQLAKPITSLILGILDDVHAVINATYACAIRTTDTPETNAKGIFVSEFRQRVAKAQADLRAGEHLKDNTYD